MPAVVKPLGALGARIEGVDLRRLSEDDARAIEHAFVEHHLLSIPGQSLGTDDVVAFSGRFGPLEPHVLSQYHHPDTPLIVVLSNIVEGGRPLGLADAGTYWHSDVSFKKQPAAATLLYALEVPDEGGDTLFCNLIAAYEALPDATRRRLDGLHAVHNYAYRSNVLADENAIRQRLTPEQLAETPSVTHPAVRTHPVSGRRAIYINPGFTVGFDGLDDAESEALKREVFEHCLQDRFLYRYKWRKGDVLIWDNAALMHSATTRDLPPDKRRLIWRTIIVGDEPR